MGSIFDRPECNCDAVVLSATLADKTSVSKPVLIGADVRGMKDIPSAAAIMAVRGGSKVELQKTIKNESKDVQYKAKGATAPGLIVALQSMVDSGFDEEQSRLFLLAARKRREEELKAAWEAANPPAPETPAAPESPAPETPPAPTGKRQKRKARQAERAAQSEAPAPEENGQPVEETASA